MDFVMPSINVNAQLCGYLLKKSNTQHNKWQKIFCIVKDGYVLYYKEEDIPRMKKSVLVALKPKGIIPLGESIVQPFPMPSHPNCIQVQNPDFDTTILLDAITLVNFETWNNVLQIAANVSHKNLSRSDIFIQNLVNHGTEIADQKEHYKREYSQAIDKNEELIRLNEVLAKEKEDLNRYLGDLQKEHKEIKKDLQVTQKSLQELETSRKNLLKEKGVLEQSLEELEVKRKKTEESLAKKNQEDTIVELKKQMDEILAQKYILELEKERTQHRLMEKEALSVVLASEKEQFITQAMDLTEAMKELEKQTIAAQHQLKLETAARQEAESRLRQAEMSLERLHGNITMGGTTYTQETKEEMSTDVKKLKDYFENLIASQKPQKGSAEEIPGVILRGGSRLDQSARQSIRVKNRSKRFREQHRSKLSGLTPDYEPDAVVMEELSTA